MTLPDLWKNYPLQIVALLGLLLIIYAPIYPGMIRQWMNDPNYSHGFLVPPIAAWFVHKSWPRLTTTDARPSSLGFGLLLFGLFLLFAGLGVNLLYLSRSSSIFILAGLLHIFLGTRALCLLALPLVFLFFMIPLPATLYDALTLPLKALVSAVATSGLKLFGFAVVREGNIIMLPNITLEVVEACSGMRSLVSLVALGTTCAFLFLDGVWRKAVLIAATVPIAVLTNVFRVFGTGVLAKYFGPGVAQGFFHDFAGFVVFAVAMLLTALTGWLLAKIPSGPKGDAHAS